MQYCDMELERYLTEKGWNWKLVEGNSQVLIKDPCPFCGRKKHLYFGAVSTKWDCKHCGRSGNLLTMKRELGDIQLETKQSSVYLFRRGPKDKPGQSVNPMIRGMDRRCHTALFKQENAEVLSYLIDIRGFSIQTIRHFKLGATVKNGSKNLVIPHYQNGRLVNVKFRTLPPEEKSFSRMPHCPSVLFNSDSLLALQDIQPRERKVIICEAETDAIAFSQIGYKFVVSSTIGASISDWPKDWLEKLEGATEILIAFDSDEAGENGALKAAQVLGKYRCKRVRLPMKDAGELISAGYGKDVFDNAIDEAEMYESEVVKTVDFFIDEMDKWLSQSNPKGRSTGFCSLDYVLGGVRDGETTIVTGETGSGKSTFTSNLAIYQIAQQVPTMICPFEQRAFEVLMKLVGIVKGKTVFQMKKSESVEVAKILVKYPIYLTDKQGPTPLGDIKDAIYYSVMRHGVKVVFLDHLHFFLEYKPGYEKHAIDQAINAVEVWSKDLGIHIFLVVHPTKLGRDTKTGQTFKVTLDNLKGSSTIKQVPDNVIIVERERDCGVGSSSDDTVISVVKCRSQAGSEGQTRLQFSCGERYREVGQTMQSGMILGGIAVDNESIERGYPTPEEGKNWEMAY